MSKSATCVQCSNECRKRDLLCSSCWNGLAPKRQDIIRRSTYRRDEVGKKFLVELLTCSISVINQMMADREGGRVFEPDTHGKHLRSPVLEQAIYTDLSKKESKELV